MTWDWGWLVKTPWVLVLVIAEPAVFKILTESEKDLAMSRLRCCLMCSVRGPSVGFITTKARKESGGGRRGRPGLFSACGEEGDRTAYSYPLLGSNTTSNQVEAWLEAMMISSRLEISLPKRGMSLLPSD